MNMSGWLSQPFSADMDVWRWILFIIFVMVIAAGWAHTMSFISGE